MFHKDGHEVWVRSTGKVIEWDHHHPITMLGTHSDITHVKHQEETLKVVTHAVQHSPIAILITDPMGVVRFVNRNYTAMTGFSEQEIVGYNILQQYRDNMSAEAVGQARTQVSRHETWRGDMEFTIKNGRKLWISVYITPISDNLDQLSHYIVIAQDITEKRAIEVQKQDYQLHLEHDLQLRMKDLEDSQKASIYALARLTEARDTDTGEHVDRVPHLCKALAIKLRVYSDFRNIIDDEFVNNLFFASPLHDIGKINIPDAILLKPGKLTVEEFEHMKLHVKSGAETLADMIRLFPNNSIILMATKIARYHHERRDGAGYLEDLQKEEIPLSARIMALVDVYDALRSKRPYKESFSHGKTCEIIQQESGTHFDPTLVEAFLSIHEQFEIIFDSF
jgi:putative two-component system response regulator